MVPVTRRIVIVAYPGVQALDVTGPFEVFVSASRLITAEGTNGVPPAYSVELVSPSGSLVETESGLSFATKPLPRTIGEIDTLVLPGGTGSRDGATRSAADRLDPRRRAQIAAPGHGVQRHVPRRRGGPGRWPHRHHALGAGAGVGRCLPGGARRRRPDLHPRRPAVEQRRCHRRHRPVAGVGRAGPRHRGRADRRPVAGDVPAPPRRPDPVRRAGVDAPRRTLGDQGGAGTHRRSSGPAITASPRWPRAPR